MDTDGNRPNVSDVIGIEGSPNPAAPLDTKPLWREGLKRVFFSAAVAAVGVLVSSVVVGGLWLWRSIADARAEHERVSKQLQDWKQRNPEIARMGDELAARRVREQVDRVL